MIKVEKDEMINESFMLNKYFYYKKENQNSINYFIFLCNGILSNMPIKYSCKKGYCFMLPKNEENKSYLFDDINEIEIMYNNNIYLMSFEEFVDKFKVYIKNYDLSAKNIDETEL